MAVPARPVWLIGLDGASFEILKPMMDAGALPVLSGLIDRGATGVMKSMVAPFTPQAWASVMTGNNPGKHGIFGFTRQLPGQPPEFLNLKSIKGDRLWTWFGQAGLSSLVVNVPLTYPPEPLNGAMITGMMTPSLDSDFTYPGQLKSRVLSKQPNYRLDVVNSTSRSRNTDILGEIESAMDIQVELVLDLVRETSVSFLFFVFVLPDRIQHMFSKFIHPKSPLYDSRRTLEWRTRIWESYARMDRAIGRLMAAAPNEANILFASDHGFTVNQGDFYANDFLASLGLLSLENASRHGIARSLIRHLNVSKVKQFVPGPWLRKTATLTKAAIDWSSTKAYASPPTQSGIFINLIGRGAKGIVPEAEYESLRDRIIEALSSIGHPHTGAPVVKGVRREDAFFGPYIETIPDILLDFGDSGFESKDAILNGHYLTMSDGQPRGIHHRDGIFVAVGPQVKPGNFEGLRLPDLAPNVLSLAGLKVPAGLDGKIRPDIFTLTGVPAGTRDKN